MKKQNIYLYPLEGKVIFPYHEYRFVISASLFNRIIIPIQLKSMTISSALSLN